MLGLFCYCCCLCFGYCNGEIAAWFRATKPFPVSSKASVGSALTPGSHVHSELHSGGPGFHFSPTVLVDKNLILSSDTGVTFTTVASILFPAVLILRGE